MTRFDGADLSHHQDDAGPIDWPTLREASWWIATKATQSTRYIDPTFDAHWAQMGIGFTHRLAYHWLSATTDPVLQADHFLSVWDRRGGAMLDAEEGGITVFDCLEWCETVEQVTRRPVAVYTGAYVAGGTIWQNTQLRTSEFGPRPMHLAAYTTEEKAKKLPGVAAYPWSAWQYSSNGPVPGVVGRCDMNRVDIPAHFDVACGIVPNPQPEDDMPAFISNKFAGKYGAAPSPQGGCTIWELTLSTKRHLGFFDWVGYGMPFGVACDDATLDGIPDYTPDGDPDTAARLAKLEAITVALNDAVGRTGQTVGDIQMNLIKAGGG